MKGYLSIGKVSKLKNVSIKSLRYYDELGILKPAYINEATNYRYYKEEQLFLLDAITLCIEFGIPLKSFPKYYDANGKVNLHNLLFDGKTLAEEKIKSMRSSIDTLQQTIRMLESSPGSVVPSRNIEKRQILTIPFDEVTTCDRYNHKLLSLFVEAQRNGISASYPSGLLYEGTGKKIEKYVFVHADFSSASPEALKKLGARTLPEGSYYVKKENKHQIEDADSFFPSLLNIEKKDHYLLIETDLLKEDMAKDTSDASLELQLLFLKK